MSNSKVYLSSLAFSLSALAFSASAETVDPLKAVSTFYDAQRLVLGFDNPDDAKSKHWLSLSIVGAIATEDDPASINDLANFCPSETANIQSYARARKLDRIYEKILGSMTGPSRPDSQEYKDAKALLQNPDGSYTDLFKTYSDKAKAYYDAEIDFKFAETAAARARAQIDLETAERDWKVAGSKVEVDAALFILRKLDDFFGDALNEERLVILERYRAKGLDFDNGDEIGAYKSPRSEVSPKVENWATGADWVSVSFSDETVTTNYNATNTSKRKMGFGSIGFLQVGISKNSGNSTESRTTDVKSFSYSFKIARVTIRRPWLDSEVFYRPLGWTWKVAENTKDYPRVSSGPDGNGVPRASEKNIYDNVAIDCTLLPTEMVIAKDRTIVATVSKETYDEINTAGSSGGGGGLFGIFGGKKRTWTTTVINTTDNDVTFQVTAPAVAVVGMISEKLPLLPEPNVDDKWPDDAWLEE